MIRRRGRSKVITLPNGETGRLQKPIEPTPMQLALARSHRWLAMLESGEVKTLPNKAWRVLTTATRSAILRVSIVYALKGENHARRRH